MTLPGSPRRAAMPGSDRGPAARWARIGGLVAVAVGVGLSASTSLAGDVVPGGTAVRSAPAPRGGAPGVAIRSFSPAYWSRWSHGPPADANWFPLGVFDNDPYHNDAAVKAARLTLYVGLYDFGSQYRHYVTDGLVRHASSAMAGEAADVDQVVADPVGGRRLWGYQPADEPEMKHWNLSSRLRHDRLTWFV